MSKLGIERMVSLKIKPDNKHLHRISWSTEFKLQMAGRCGMPHLWWRMSSALQDSSELHVLAYPSLTALVHR